MSATDGAPGTGALDGIGAPVDLLALIVDGTVRPLVGPPPDAQLIALLPVFEAERPGARRLDGGRLAVHVPLGDGRAHLWQVGDGDVALPHLIRSLVRASRHIALQGSAPVPDPVRAPGWRLPLLRSLETLPRKLGTRRLAALERLADATGWTGLALVEVRRGKARRVYRLSPTADLRNDSILVFSNRMLQADERVLSVDAREVGDRPADLELYAEEHRIQGFTIQLPEDEGQGLYVEGIVPEAQVAEAQAALSVAFPRHSESSSGLLQRALYLAAAAALIAFLAWPVRFEVTAPGELRPANSEVVIASEEARLDSVEVVVGDDVVAGQVLATLASESLIETRDEAVLNQLLEGLSAQEALAAGDYARYQLALQRQEIAGLRVARMEERLATLVLTAPGDGRVADLIPRSEIGAQITPGASLAEIQYGNVMRALLSLSAIDAPLVRNGAEGTFVLRGISDRSWPIVVVEDPIASRQEDGNTVLLVSAEVTNADADLFKGLTGIARIELGEAARLVVLTRPLVEWIRLTAWEKLGLRL